jgi:hypothetical protein
MSHIHTHICNLSHVTEVVERPEGSIGIYQRSYEWPCGDTGCDRSAYKLCMTHNPGQILMTAFDLKFNGDFHDPAVLAWHRFYEGDRNDFTSNNVKAAMGRWGVLQYQTYPPTAIEGQREGEVEVVYLTFLALMPDGFWRHGYVFESGGGVFLDESELIAAQSADEAKAQWQAFMLGDLIEKELLGLLKLLNQAHDNPLMKMWLLESYAGSNVNGTLIAWRRHNPQFVWPRNRVYPDPAEVVSSET